MQQNEGGGLLSYLWNNSLVNFIKYFISGVWNGLAWTFNLIIPRGDVGEDTHGEEFKN